MPPNEIPPSLLINLLQEAASDISRILAEAEISLKENSADFISKNYVMLGKAIGVYARLLKGTGCPTQDQFEKLCASNSHHPKTREMLEELLIQEETWDQFLAKVDLLISGTAPSGSTCLSTGYNCKLYLSSLALTNVEDNSSKHVKQIEMDKSRFASLNCDIHIISFGTTDGALKWKQETGCPFPVWIDGARHMYNALGFKRSMFQVWKIETMVFYGSQVSQNVDLPKPFTDYEDDPLQMAGNVMFDSKGEMIFLHSSQFPADRPSVETMLSVISNSA